MLRYFWSRHSSRVRSAAWCGVADSDLGGWCRCGCSTAGTEAMSTRSNGGRRGNRDMELGKNSRSINNSVNGGTGRSMISSSMGTRSMRVKTRSRSTSDTITSNSGSSEGGRNNARGVV